MSEALIGHLGKENADHMTMAVWNPKLQYS